MTVSLLLEEGHVKELEDGLSIERREGGYEVCFWRESSEQYSTVWVSDMNAVWLLKFLKADLRLAEHVRIKPKAEIVQERTWNRVMELLGALYESWAKSTVPWHEETNGLMRAYDEWLG